ncbi:MAG: hypothetical protein WC822_03505 [Candidatus Paceibacterota bacterium]|jgi:hypothetical protein
MEYKSENRICQNCQQDFTIESEDFNFYEKMKVPPPTFCPECRFQRRATWRNERTLYKRNCDLCNKKFISMHDKDARFPVYCKECWDGDNWNRDKFEKDYDFAKPFFEQFDELHQKVPRIGIWQRSTINCPYSNMCGESKNVYLSISVVAGSENVFYSRIVDKSSDIFDCYSIKECENCYENIESEKNYNCQNLFLSRSCLDSFFLVDCVNCSNCILSYNLRNKQFYIKNQQYSKEEYFKELEKLNLGDKEYRQKAIEEFENICKKAIYRYANIYKSIDSSGNNILNSRNIKKCFDVYNSENCKYVYRGVSFKDGMDITFGGWSELFYEYTTGSMNGYNVKFSYSAVDQARNVEYADSCSCCSNVFGCISLKNKNYSILNKQYTKEEYKKMIEKIKKQMNEIPYMDKRGRVYKYGEFFPAELSCFAYNETMAQDFFPLTKEQALKEGYKWKEKEKKNFEITLKATEIPKNIKDVDDKILEEVLGCVHEGKCDHRCYTAFRLTQDEFNFYKKNNIPIPNECANCRYSRLFAKILPPKFWHRRCMKEGCENEFETSYAPDRPEIVYCEKCYQQEVY